MFTPIKRKATFVLISRKRFHVSRRDAFLALFGVVYCLIGYSYLSIPNMYKPLIRAQLRFAFDLFPIEVYAWAWIACGITAIVGAAFRRLDWLGFSVAAFMPFFWSLAYWIAEVQDGIPRAWVGGVTYAAFAFAINLVGGMPDPTANRDTWWSR